MLKLSCVVDETSLELKLIEDFIAIKFFSCLYFSISQLENKTREIATKLSQLSR